MDSFTKSANEIITLEADFSSALRAGETIDINNVALTGYVLPAETTDNSIIVAGSTTVTGATISFRAQAGSVNVTYKVTVSTGATSQSNLYEQDLFMLVSNSGAGFVSLSTVKQALGLTVTTHDGLLVNLIDTVSSFVESETKRKFSLNNYVEVHYPEDRRTYITPSNFPIQSVSSIVVAGLTLEPLTGTESNYVVENNVCIVRLDGGTFPSKPHKTEISYKAGFLKVPSDIERVVIKLVSTEFNRRMKEGILAESMGDYKVSFGEIKSAVGADMSTADILARYKKRNF